MSDKRTQVIGHRGARWNRPENSLAGFSYALEAGVDAIELDLNVTKDHVLVLHHDQILNTTLCQQKDASLKLEEKPLYQYLWEELKELDCGTQINPQFPTQIPAPGESLLRLQDLFEWIHKRTDTRAHSLRFNIEAKSSATQPDLQPDPKTYVDLIHRELNRAKMLSRVTFKSFDHRLIRYSKEVCPALKTAALYESKPIDFVRQTKDCGADVVCPLFKILEKEDVQKIQEAGLEVLVWTLNQEKDWEKMLEWKVDGIITDRPLDLIRYLSLREEPAKLE